MFGIITKYSDRGFGFVRSSGVPDASDIFFHVSDLTFPEEQVRNQLPIEFDLGKHRGNTVARNIRLLEVGGAG